MPADNRVLTEDEKQSSASFRVWSNDVTPEEIAALIGLQPTRQYHKGDLVSKRLTITRKVHFFLIASPLPSSDPLQNHLEWLCDLIEPVISKLATMAGRCEWDIFCGFISNSGQGGFTLSAQLLHRLAALKLRLGVDLYPPTLPLSEVVKDDIAET